MSKGWNAKKKRLEELIKLVSDQHGGDDPEWLKGYSQDVIKKYTDKLEKAILCFESLLLLKEEEKTLCDARQRNDGGKLMEPFTESS